MGLMTGETQIQKSHHPPSSSCILRSQRDHRPLSLPRLYVFIAGNSKRLREINSSLLEALATS